MLIRIHNAERGASAFEYGAVIMLVAALVGTVLVVLPQSGTTITAGITEAIEHILDGGGDGSEGGDVTTAAGDEGDGGGGAQGGPDDGDSGTGGDGADGDSGDDGAGGGDDGDDGGGCGWNLFCHGGNAVDTVTDWGGDALSHVGDFFGGVGEGIWGDVTGLWDTFTTNPIDTIRDTWNGIREDPWSLLISPEAREAWSNGEYGRALGLGAWDVGSWFIPGAGWAAKAGKLGRLGRGPDTPDRPRDNSDNGDNNDSNRRDDEENSNDRADASCPTGNSFVPGTPVLLADGTHADIESVRVGDEVWAFDPLTGEEGPRAVTNLVTGDGPTTLVEITIADTDGTTATVTATDGHPFWLPETAVWVDAVDLEPGMWLRAADGDWAQVQDTDVATVPDQQVHNLSVDDLHTYHVAAGETDVLTHNQGNPYCSGGEDRLNDELDAIDQNYNPAIIGGVEHNLRRIDEGADNHIIAGTNSATDLADYLNRWTPGQMTHTDSRTNNRITYDSSTLDADGNGVVIIETSHNVHAYHMSRQDFDRHVNDGRYVED